MSEKQVEQVEQAEQKEQELQVELNDQKEVDQSPQIDVNTGEEIKDGEHEEQPESKPKTDTESSEPEKKDEAEESHPTFDQVEKDENGLKKYNKNEQALYWKWKTDKHKKQEAVKASEDLKAQVELKEVQALNYKNQIDKLKEMLTKGTDLTAEELLKVVDVKREEEPAPKVDEAARINQKIATKAQFAEKIGSAKYDNFQDIAQLAKDVIAEDKSGTYQKLVAAAFTDDSVDEEHLVERIVSIARLSDKYNEVSKSVKSEKKDTVDRALKNATKKISSASIGNAGGKRVVSESELTVADASSLSTKEWNKLKDSTRQRILMGIDP